MKPTQQDINYVRKERKLLADKLTKRYGPKVAHVAQDMMLAVYASIVQDQWDLRGKERFEALRALGDVIVGNVAVAEEAVADVPEGDVRVIGEEPQQPVSPGPGRRWVLQPARLLVGDICFSAS